jgi:predicted metalloprotease with PDZ domain
MATEEVPATTAPVPLRREAIVPTSDRGRLAAIVATCSLAGLAGGMALSMLAETHRAARQSGGAGYHARHAGPKTWLGMKVKDEKQGACTGAAVTEITANGPADRVGFHAGDVVLAFDGQRICGHDHLIEEIRASDIGAAPEITVRRGSARLVLQPTLAEMPPRIRNALRPDER